MKCLLGLPFLSSYPNAVHSYLLCVKCRRCGLYSFLMVLRVGFNSLFALMMNLKIVNYDIGVSTLTP